MDISVFGLGTVAAITVLCYLAGTGVKTTPLDNKYIPVICGGAGLVLGLAALYAGMPEFRRRTPSRRRLSAWCPDLRPQASIRP